MTSLKNNSVLWFVVLTVTLSFATYFLPLPVEQRSLFVPVLFVFIPTIVSIPLALITEGVGGIRQIFARSTDGVKWLLIGASLGALMRVLVWGAAKLFSMPVQADFSAPGTWFVVFATIPLAIFEEIGWRGFALQRILKTRSPLDASLLLGIPWAIILLPGMMSEGAPVVAQLLVLIALSIIIMWVYVHSGHSLWSVTLLHGIHNGLVTINRGLSIVTASWLMLGVYIVVAILLILLDRCTFFARLSPL